MTEPLACLCGRASSSERFVGQPLMDCLGCQLGTASKADVERTQEVVKRELQYPRPIGCTQDVVSQSISKCAEMRALNKKTSYSVSS